MIVRHIYVENIRLTLLCYELLKIISTSAHGRMIKFRSFVISFNFKQWSIDKVWQSVIILEVFIQTRLCQNFCLVGTFLCFNRPTPWTTFVFLCTFSNCRCHAKCLTCEISDFRPCANAQSIILHIAEKFDY